MLIVLTAGTVQIKYGSGKARGSDMGHMVDRIITYIPSAHGDQDTEVYPAAIEKNLRGYKSNVTTRELIPPNLIDVFEERGDK